MISVAQALAQVFDLLEPLGTETISLEQAMGRVLAQDAVASHNQPPFASSAMDGYALVSSDALAGNSLTVIGESAAGSRFDGAIEAGQCVRIFTGAPVPTGANKILIQEDCIRSGNTITISQNIDTAAYIRPKGTDFSKGATIPAPRTLTPNDITLLAAMNIGRLTVTRKPVIALVATGDELVMPNTPLGPDQIVSSNNFGLKALIESHGGIARLMPLARDDEAVLRSVLNMCLKVDLIITLGGASVGDHDLMGKMIQSGEMDSSFYKVAMRPGKPLLAGRYKGVPLIGLPGNPVSAMVCGHVFIRPAINALLGLDKTALETLPYTLSHDLGANGARAHYMRAVVTGASCQVFDRQDSALLSVLAQSNALMVRPPHDPAKSSGDLVDVILL
ncbi:MAG: molybdopterin molybdenumtransferase MoeA [Rhodobacteraceae bacterium]|nr:MAG: molybdopterin molybdenumtransferase MoeA [Paracoccaceae bacterium]